MSASVTQLLPTSPPDLEKASDQALVRLVQSLPRGSAEHDAACEALVARYQSLVRSCAQRHWQSPESQEELMQVGYVGLLKAINNFDPAIGCSLAAYAQPCISGELKPHFGGERSGLREVHGPRLRAGALDQLRGCLVGPPPGDKDSPPADSDS